MDSSWILIVEDSLPQAKRLQDILENNNYKVKVAYSGEEALLHVKESKPSMIISDVIMPGISGFELCAQIKNDNNLKDISVILLTSLSNSKDIIKGLESGADNFLVKPYDEKNILSRVRYILINKELRSQGSSQIGIEVFFLGQKFNLNSERIQMVDLLLSTYQDAVSQNLELIKAKDELKKLNANLETLVKERTEKLEKEITERKIAEEKIKHLAYYDALTGLPNRVLFSDMLNNCLAHAKRSKHMGALIFLDLDSFKIVNDTVGHILGDELLKEAAKRLLACVREEDIVARMGGDEFSILMPQITCPEDAAILSDRILKKMEEPWHTAGYVFYNTVSLGIAVYLGGGTNAEKLLKDADTAMYRAKERGKNNYAFYKDSMNHKIMERLDIESKLRYALDNNELTIYYQPIINAKTKIIEGSEALLRWKHPEKGLLLPDAFISTAEETGLIIPIGEWVLRQACAQTKAWQEQSSAQMYIAVNISALQFKQLELVDIVSRILRETGLLAKFLRLEITETTAIKDIDFTYKQIRELRAMGVKIAMDDFGTGYSSLNCIRNFPIDMLKIDRSFVKGIFASPEDKEIVSSIIKLSKSLNIRVVAEGVETEAQSNFLLERNCDEIQGFLYSKPIPPLEMSEMLRK